MDTTWQKVSKWYDKSVGDEGHYYHQHIILPKLFELMNLKPGDSVLDVACGQGVLAKQIHENIRYIGLDGSVDFIQSAKRIAKKNQRFFVADATKSFPFDQKEFTHACIVLALQNIEKPDETIKLTCEKLEKNGKIFLVLNHPFFRIPKSSSWGWDEGRKLQFRIVEKYLSYIVSRITAHPGLKNDTETVSFHYSFSEICGMLFDAGMVIEGVHEWISDKQSTGGRARAENISRREFPLFMTIVARKI